MAAVVTIVVLVFLGTWISVRAIGLNRLGLLPAHARPRAAWLFGHARMIELACVLVAVAAATTRVGG